METLFLFATVLTSITLIVMVIVLNLCVKHKYWSKDPSDQIYEAPNLMEKLAFSDHEVRASKHRVDSRKNVMSICSPTYAMVKSPLRKSVSEGDILEWIEENPSNTQNGSTCSLSENFIKNTFDFNRRYPPKKVDVTRSCESLDSFEGNYTYVDRPFIKGFKTIGPAGNRLSRIPRSDGIYEAEPPPCYEGPLVVPRPRATIPLPAPPCYESFSSDRDMYVTAIAPEERESCYLQPSYKKNGEKSGTTKLHTSVPLKAFFDKNMSKSCIDLRMTIHPTRVSIHAAVIPQDSLELSTSESSSFNDVSEETVTHSYDSNMAEYFRPYSNLIDPHNSYF